jgi:hypothetical protein
MRVRGVAIVMAAAFLVSACAPDRREWMKLNEKYTTEDFRRDHAACSKGGQLDEACMRSRGWVDVSASKTEKPPDPRGGPGVRPRY